MDFRELIGAYKGLHQLDYLHSVEVYQNKVLVGGLYGITFHGAFLGESMFSKVPQASKCARKTCGKASAKNLFCSMFNTKQSI